eukprot:TRINITY_DN2700_c0_g1_i8.p1 TRINITY_DN2700_c0_g1~~TRINITY_DN2700_c0_g1_i8.p1  ORF type:complete len:344 (+),score=27.32 TRINITY_DN2700_c0_g1_i8:86-1117(+)
METTRYCNRSVGPKDLLNSLGVSVLVPGYVVVSSIVTLLLFYALWHRLKSERRISKIEAYLILFPSLMAVISVLPLVSPLLGQMVSIVQDLLCVTAMFAYMKHTKSLLGGSKHLVADKSSCPFAVPPLCCFAKCKKPKMTRTLMKILFLPIQFIVVLNFVVLLVNCSLAYNGFPPPKESSDIPNIPSYMLIPFQISALYTYKVFMSYFEARLRGSFPRTRGRLILATFILCKSTGGIFQVLESKEVLGYLDGLDCVNFGQLLLPVVQLGLLLPVALIIPKVYTKKWQHPIQQAVEDIDKAMINNGKCDTKLEEGEGEKEEGRGEGEEGRGEGDETQSMMADKL